MAQTTETSERGPWTVQRVLEQLDSIGVFDAQEILGALRPERETLALALRDALHDRNGRAKLTAAVLLLLLNDTSGRDPFLEALTGPDGDVRTLAVEFLDYRVFRMTSRPETVSSQRAQTAAMSCSRPFSAICTNHGPG